jgi:hypothetical protein
MRQDGRLNCLALDQMTSNKPELPFQSPSGAASCRPLHGVKGIAPVKVNSFPKQASHATHAPGSHLKFAIYENSFAGSIQQAKAATDRQFKYGGH